MENLKQIQGTFKKDANRVELINHHVLKFLKDEELNHEQIAKLLSQWYFPLANFPLVRQHLVAPFIGLTNSAVVTTTTVRSKSRLIPPAFL